MEYTVRSPHGSNLHNNAWRTAPNVLPSERMPPQPKTAVSSWCFHTITKCANTNPSKTNATDPSRFPYEACGETCA